VDSHTDDALWALMYVGKARPLSRQAAPHMTLGLLASRSPATVQPMGHLATHDA
jgi:hypothetical protein